MSVTDYLKNDSKKIKIDFPSVCNANCIGCYSRYSEKNPSTKLSVELITRILGEAKVLEINRLVIAADGEPLVDPDYLFSVIEQADKQGMETIIYTNGSLITEELAFKLYHLNTSLFVKRNSMVHDRQNTMMGAGLSGAMLRAVYYLMDAGFDHERLALESFVSKENEHDLDDVLRFSRSIGVMPYFEEFICINQPAAVIDKMVMTPTQLRTAFERYQRIDAVEFGIQTCLFPGSRRYGVNACSFNGMMSVDTEGNVKMCIIGEGYGNVHKSSLIEINDRIPKSCGGCSATVLTIEEYTK
jgi:MoaA/NifB/PqqE/SkfB family radical SAM enzyme